MTLPWRSLAFHWRTNLAVTLGVVVGTAALTGALLVGESMRGSLREAALGRLGLVDHALVSHRFFRQQLTSELAASVAKSGISIDIAPVVLLSGGASHADSRARANRIDIIGADAAFWKLSATGVVLDESLFAGLSVVLNEPLAAELGAASGEEVLIRLGKPRSVSSETLLGKRDASQATLRLRVVAIVPARDIGALSLTPQQALPKNAYIPLDTLQRTLERPGRINAALVACNDASNDCPTSVTLQSHLQREIELEDIGVRLRRDDTRGYIAVESEAMLIDPAIEAAVAAAVGDDALAPGLTYLANRISKEETAADTSGGIPYSTVTAIDPLRTGLEVVRGASSIRPGDVLLNEWAAEDLSAKVGDRITLTYFVTGEFGQLEERDARFLLRGVVSSDGQAADPGWVPEYKGVTDTQNLADWEPPFPMDMKSIREKDEAYWDAYRTTPKAFVTLEDGLRLWGDDAERFGRFTSMRFYPRPHEAGIAEGAAALESAILRSLDLSAVGLSFDAVRARMKEAGAGTTDFGGLFIGFSFFLIASAAMLVALLFRLGIERRASEVGLLLALGFAPRSVAMLLIVEGLLTAVVGGVLGVLGSLGYAWFMLEGLRSWWSDAVNTPFLRLHVSTQSVTIGLLASLLLAIVSMAWSIRGLTGIPTRALLGCAGILPVDKRGSRTVQKGGAVLRWLAVGGCIVAISVAGVSLLSDLMPQTVAFFLSGSSLLAAGVARFSVYLRGERTEHVIQQPGRRAMVRLGLRNAMRHRGRSVLTSGLIASATFLIVALDAFYVDAGTAYGGLHSGSGGFSLFAESATPLVYDLSSPDGREALGVTTAGAFDGVSVFGFRLRGGDDASCVNLYKPTEHRVIGASQAMIRRGGFTFSSSTAETDAQRTNPWLLLNQTLSDGAIPVIGDESAVLWQLHLGLRKDLVIQDQRGRDVRLRFVALLAGSALQGELIVAESHFVQLFPSIDGHGFFLIETPGDRATAVENLLERELESFGFDVGSTEKRLAAYLAVQNTYLSTFQLLGGFGLILGTVGMTAVMLRNVWERRGELALMRAVGFSRMAIGCVVLSENTMLLIVGLLAGVASALVAVGPHILTRPTTIPWASLGMTLGAVFAVGVCAGMVAIMPTLRAPLIPALRRE